MERHQITGHTELTCLLAYPIRHSNSPAMHNDAYEKLGKDVVNLAFEVDAEHLEDAIKGVRAMRILGGNISMPNKTIVHKYLDEVDPAAELVGACNTFTNRNGYLKGYVTDGIGYMASLKDNDIDIIGKKITIAGSGGAATAIQIQAALDGVAEMSIFARDDKFYANAVETVDKINSKTNCKATLFHLEDLDALKQEIASSVLFTNATGCVLRRRLPCSRWPRKSDARP